jgi:phosphohistidine phosphatase
MKTLLLMRHAKSSWKHPDLPDIDRPLKKRGKKDVQRMAKLITEAELVPQAVYCSPALRARLTAEAILHETSFKGEIQYLDTLYLGEPENYIEVLGKCSDSLDRVMVIGHNPGLESVLQALSGRVESLPTGAIAYISLQIKSWKELNDEPHGDLISLWRPGDLK